MIPRLSCVLVVLAALAARGAEEDRFANVEVKSEHVAGSVHVLTGLGGNIGASIGQDGTLIIDDQFEPLAERIAAALSKAGGNKPRFVLNTHFHGDHTGSNAYFGDTGAIVAHDNVRVRLLAQPNVARAALPLVTYSDRVRIHFNDDEIDVMHLPSGHTDGDSVAWFKKANVVHMGDLFFNGSFPFVDLKSGGTVAGYLEAQKAVLGWMPPDARVIPGHGPLATPADLRAINETLGASVEIVRDAAAAGKTLDQIVAMGLGPEHAKLATGFIKEDVWIRTVHASYFGAPP
jgi:glyoxylase-like metal-dependent hydrolase (beta-lactamase superfamily II)